jgi:1-acyl-sn-glycerol-3-phosphate acyltransferase
VIRNWINDPDLLIFSVFDRVILRNSRALSNADYWGPIRNIVTKMWSIYGWIWYGHEIIGLENIPRNGPALIIYYHGAITVDSFFIGAKVYQKFNRLIFTVADRFLFKIPGELKKF